MMKFVSLLKFYYKNTPEEYEKEYQKRFKAPFAVKAGFNLTHLAG